MMEGLFTTSQVNLIVKEKTKELEEKLKTTEAKMSTVEAENKKLNEAVIILEPLYSKRELRVQMLKQNEKLHATEAKLSTLEKIARECLGLSSLCSPYYKEGRGRIEKKIYELMKENKEC